MLLKAAAQDGWFLNKQLEAGSVFFSLSFLAGLVKPEWQVVTQSPD